MSLVCVPAAAAQGSLIVVANGAADGRTRLIVGTDRDPPVRPASLSASVDGVVQQTRVEPVLSERLAVAVVVDASAGAAPVLPAGVTGAANLVLAASAARGTLVVDTTPPAVAAAWPSEREAMLRGLSAVRAGGDRDTAAALDLALAQLPAAATEPRVVVLFTGAPDAGGDAATSIVDRMRAAGVLVAVVETGEAGSGFWSAVAAGTGGVAVRAAPTDVVAAFDRVAEALQRRYLLTIPTPDRLPAAVVVQTDAGDASLVGQATAAPAPQAAGFVAVTGVALVAVLAAAALLAVVALRTARWPGRRRPDPLWNIPPRPVPFVERDPLRMSLAAALREERPVWLCSAAAGSGTSTTAIEFAHHHRPRYDIAWWIPARDPDLVPDYLAELAERAGLAAPADSADQATAKLVEALRRRSRWLLVFDDAACASDLAPYLPDGPGDVIVTSAEADTLAAAVSVPPFTCAEAVALVRSARPDLSAAEAERLAVACDNLPVALGPVAAGPVDVRAFCCCPERATGPDAVWAVLLDHLAVEDSKALALLTVVAWMGQAPVPLALVARHPVLAGDVTEPAELLHRRGLAGLTAAGLLLHPTPARLLRHRSAADHPGHGGWPAIAVRLLREATPGGPPADPAARSAWRQLMPHIVAATDPARPLDVVADDVGWLLDRAGRYLAARGRSRAAQALIDDARDAARRGRA
jgi:hypothetical protein